MNLPETPRSTVPLNQDILSSREISQKCFPVEISFLDSNAEPLRKNILTAFERFVIVYSLPNYLRINLALQR